MIIQLILKDKTSVPIAVIEKGYRPLLIKSDKYYSDLEDFKKYLVHMYESNEIIIKDEYNIKIFRPLELISYLKAENVKNIDEDQPLIPTDKDLPNLDLSSIYEFANDFSEDSYGFIWIG